MNDSPEAIIFYNGGSCGDLLKTLCLSQLVDDHDLSMNDVGKVSVDQRFKFKLEEPNLPHSIPHERIECAHRCSDGIVAHFSGSRLFWIRMPESLNLASTSAVFRKIGIKDHVDWAMKSPTWFAMAEEKLGRPIENDEDMIAARLAELKAYDGEMVELASARPIGEIPFESVIHPVLCARVVEKVIASPLRKTEKFYRQHWQWRRKNAWFLEMINEPAVHGNR